MHHALCNNSNILVLFLAIIGAHLLPFDQQIYLIFQERPWQSLLRPRAVSKFLER